MKHFMIKPHRLTIRQYVARFIDLNEYLASFPGATMSDKMGVTEFNGILLKVCQTAGQNKRMYRVLIVKLFL